MILEKAVQDVTHKPDLAEFLEVELKRSSYRDLETKTNVSRGSLENIIKRQNKDLPTLETLQGIANGFQRDLWEIVDMAVDLQLPQSPTDLGKRMAAIVDRHPKLARMFDRLQAIEHQRPDLVTGVIVTIEVLDRQQRQRRQKPRIPPLPRPNHPKE